MTATLALIGGVLQLTVPSYALRLVRRFGAQRVGWFVVISFSSLALLHLLGPLRLAMGSTWQAMPDGVYAIGSVLLLIGMVHLETLFAERERVRATERQFASRCETPVMEGAWELAKANEELLAEIGRRDHLEKALRESEAQYRLVFAENPQPMWIFDVRTSRFLAVNHAALRQYGFTPQEFSALTVRDLLPGTTVGKFLQYVAECCTGAEARGQWQHYKKDGTPIDVEITATDITYAGAPARLVLAEDIGRRRRRELELRLAGNAEIMGRVAGGIAHHYDPLLTAIQGRTSALLNQAEDPATIEELKQISSAATQATAFARRLLVAGGRHPAQPEPLDLNGLIRSHRPMLQRLVGDRIAIETTCGSFLAPTLADPFLVENILVNLVLNARDAMPNGGTITISTVTLRLDETQAQGNVEARAGDFVRLAISDTGCGMTPEVQARLFEAFNTAKANGKGPGLGLAGVYGSVRQLSGWIEYTTDVGVGTEFRVFLPPAPPTEVLARIQAQASAPVLKGTVLLVEPEERARVLARCVLNWNDYKVIEADDATTALVLWESRASDIDLLLSGINLSGDESGRNLAARLQKAKPGLKVIYTCASSTEVEAKPPVAPQGLKFISKPYTPDQLIRAVESALPRTH